jgi:hypothetical protein
MFHTLAVREMRVRECGILTVFLSRRRVLTITTAVGADLERFIGTESAFRR